MKKKVALAAFLSMANVSAFGADDIRLPFERLGRVEVEAAYINGWPPQIKRHHREFPLCFEGTAESRVIRESIKLHIVSEGGKRFISNPTFSDQDRKVCVVLTVESMDPFQGRSWLTVKMTGETSSRSSIPANP